MPSKATRGRPTVLTLRLQEEITKLLSNGAYVRHACSSVGIAYASFQNWLKKGGQYEELLAEREALERAPRTHPGRRKRLGDVEKRLEALQPFFDFLVATEKARADAANKHVLYIQKAGASGDWRASAWFLERAFPDQFGRRRLELSGPGGGPIRTVHAEIDLNADPEDLDPNALDRLYGSLLQAGEV